MYSSSVAKLKITLLCLICGFSSLLSLIMLFDVLEILAQNLILIVLALIMVVNISIGLTFYLLSNFASNFDEVIAVFNGTVFMCTVALNLAGCVCIGIFILHVLNDDYNSIFLDSLESIYGSPFRKQTTTAWDNIQSNWKCCGLIDKTNWRKSHWFLSQRTFPRLNVPSSCLDPVTLVPFDNDCLREIRRHVLLIGLLVVVFTSICVWYQLKTAYKLYTKPTNREETTTFIST